MKSFVEWAIERDPETAEIVFEGWFQNLIQRAGDWMRGKAAPAAQAAISRIGTYLSPDKARYYEIIKDQLEQLKKTLDRFLIGKERETLAPEELKKVQDLKATAEAQLKVVDDLEKALEAATKAAPKALPTTQTGVPTPADPAIRG